ncbi:MAG: tRNA (adenosine(37)-N6)-threonylcarbamoyltransferase complex dimerization subunit type 1 TsaB [Gemmatimonadaceae bacterium]
MTGITLAFDAATYAGTVAVFRDYELLAGATLEMRDRKEERLMPAIAHTLARARVTPRDVGRVTCGGGPGSFTSLRIAAAIAKGLTVSLGAELWVVPSLALVVAGNARCTAGRYIAALDAMRGEWYARPFVVGPGGEVHPDGEPALWSTETLEAETDRRGATLVGPGLRLDAGPHARGVTRLSPGPLLAKVNHETWEPDYGRLAEAQVKWEQVHGRALRADE